MASGSNDEDDIAQQAKNEIDETVQTLYGTLHRQDLLIRQTGHKLFSIQAPYAAGKNKHGEWTWDFDTTGATIHLKYAREEVNKYPSSTAPDQKGAIGVEGDVVTGTEIVVPAMKINVKYRHPEGELTIAEARRISRHTGKTNTSTFLTYDAGEVLFLGARGSDGETAEAEVTYHFAMAENEDNLTIGDITGIEKKAWDVGWVQWEDKVASANGDDHPTRVPKFVYIDRVYNKVDLASVLGFGGS